MLVIYPIVIVLKGQMIHDTVKKDCQPLVPMALQCHTQINIHVARTQRVTLTDEHFILFFFCVAFEWISYVLVIFGLCRVNTLTPRG